MITAKDLTKRFGSITAVDRVGFSLQRGEVLGFLGPNGAGKSTTMKMLTGFLAPDGGTAEVAGHDVTRDPIAVRQAIGYVPENAPLYEDMTPASLLRFVLKARGIEGGSAKAAIDRVVPMCSIDSVFYQPIETLSKGYKRRVGLAQALVHDPDVLILDEPTDGLDPNQKHGVREMIRGMSGNKCIIISTHILEEVEAVCSRAIIIGKGKRLADGTPDELKAQGGGSLDAYFRQITTGEAAA